jgi:exopolyphosphatase/guanosine-5'-triphosphate,3'-diphosphate pyrophosphatase
MPRYAAIDIGSNSVRMLAAEVLPGGETQVLASEREVTRLGASVFRTGMISDEAMASVCGVLSRMAEVYRRFDVVGARAVATAAVRDASNSHYFLDLASEAIGVPVEVISGQEEARLIHLGVQSRWPHPRHRVLIVDVGGGSAEIVLSENGRIQEAFSRPLGAVRLTSVFLNSDPPDPLQIRQLEQFIDEKLAAVYRRIGHFRCDRMIATSSTAAALVCAANRIPRARRDEADRHRATQAQIRRLFQQLTERNREQRMRIPGIGPRRAEIIVAGVAVLRRIVEQFGLPSLYYSTAGVRDGIIADLAARRVGSELLHLTREQRQTVEAMARRFAVPIKHARHVAASALKLFENLQQLHGLRPYYGKLLEAACYLYDVGHYINDTAHHKHSQYIVEHSGLPSFTDHERLLIAMLCRYHRKSMPNARHLNFEALDAEARRVVLNLIPIIRLADAMDRGKEQRVRQFDCALRNGAVNVTLRSEEDIDLEIWAARQAAPSFEQVYGKPLQVSRSRR